MIDAFKGASGKICEHSDMGASYNARTGDTFSHKLCNPRNLQDFPYSEKELAQQAAFKIRATVVSSTVKALNDEQRKALIVVRNQRKLFCIRQLIDDIYDKETQTVPADALAALVAEGTSTASVSSGTGDTSAGTGGSSSSSGTGDSSSSSSGGENAGGDLY